MGHARDTAPLPRISKSPERGSPLVTRDEGEVGPRPRATVVRGAIQDEAAAVFVQESLRFGPRVKPYHDSVSDNAVVLHRALLGKVRWLQPDVSDNAGRLGWPWVEAALMNS